MCKCKWKYEYVAKIGKGKGRGADPSRKEGLVGPRYNSGQLACFALEVWVESAREVREVDEVEEVT